MAKIKANIHLPFPEKNKNQSLYDWLYRSIREGIINGRFSEGIKLPSSRELSSQYKISRGTVVNVYEQLVSEGYLESKTGYGTRVSSELPDLKWMISKKKQKIKQKLFKKNPKKLSQKSSIIKKVKLTPSTPKNTKAFRTHLPDLNLFPIDIWSRIAGRRMRNLPKNLLGVGDPQGYYPLREVLSEYLQTSRAVNCTPEQIIITSGVHQALEIAAKAILDPKDSVWLEDPGFIGARNIFDVFEAQIHPIPVDNNGMNIDKGIEICKKPRLIYTTPSHQFPIGCNLSLKRKMKLLEFARSSGSWIFEDDYDSEYRYNSKPLPSLQSLDNYDSVLYSSSFSKVLFMDVRIGYLIVPQNYVNLFIKAKAVSERFTSTLNQAILCDFITEGHFGRHLRKTRQIYKTRYEALNEYISKKLSGIAILEKSNAGLQTILWLPKKIDDIKFSKQARKAGLELLPVSPFYLSKKKRNGVILGFASLNEGEIKKGVDLLSMVMNKYNS